MSESFDIIFRGDILPGHTLPDVRARMAQLFKLDDAKLAVVFSGKPIALKKNCDAAMAEKLKAVLTKAGAQIEVKSNTPAASPPPAPPPQTTTPTEAAPQPTAQREPAPAEPTPQPEPQQAKPETEPGEIALAPKKGWLVSPNELPPKPPPVEVNTDHIQLEKRKATFLLPEDDEPAPAASTPEIEAPDFGLFDAGADLLDENERTEFVELDLDLSAISMAEVGADVLREEEKKPAAKADVKDLEADLAPPGTDMGQIKGEPPPPPPDTDHIDLA